MRYNFKSLGIKLLIGSIILVFLMKYINISFNYKLFIGTFFIGSSIFLIALGKVDPPE